MTDDTVALGAAVGGADRAPKLERVPCPRCGGVESSVMVRAPDRLHGLPGDYVVSECRGCRLWFQNPRVPVERLATLYPGDYKPHLGAADVPLGPGRLEYLRRRLGYLHLPAAPAREWRALPLLDPLRRWQAGVDLIPEFVQGGRLLDVGCADGTRLRSLRQLGWHHLHGIELVPAAAARACAAGFDVVCAPVEKALAAYPDGSFDVIVSSMVLEHLADPFQVVSRIADKLRPSGEFLFSTIVRDSLDAWLYGEYWSGFDLPRHLVYFRRRDIDAMLGSRFEVAGRDHHSAVIDFIRPSTWRLPRGRRLDRAILALARTPSGARLGLGLAWLRLTCRVSVRCRRVPAGRSAG